MNPLIQGKSGTTPVMSRNAFSTNQGTNEDDSQSNPHPEAGIFGNQTMRISGLKDRRDMVTGVQSESLCGHDMMTGATEQTRSRRDMVTGVQSESRCGRDMVTGATKQIGNRHYMTGVHEEVTYCSPSTSSGKQKKKRFTSQPQFRSEKPPATIEADQNLLALQQLANNTNSANFHKNINRISKLPKSLTTTMPTFDGKSEKIDFFEDLFQTSLKIHNELIEDDRINYFHSLMRGMHYKLLRTLMAQPERTWEKF